MQENDPLYLTASQHVPGGTVDTNMHSISLMSRLTILALTLPHLRRIVFEHTRSNNGGFLVLSN